MQALSPVTFLHCCVAPARVLDDANIPPGAVARLSSGSTDLHPLPCLRARIKTQRPKMQISPLSLSPPARGTPAMGIKEKPWLADCLGHRSASGTTRPQLEHSCARLSELSATVLIQGAAPLQLYHPVLSGERLACREAKRSKPSLCCCGYSMPGHSQLIPVGAIPAAGSPLTAGSKPALVH